MKFFLIDIDYADFDERVFIVLYGRTADGRRITVIDPTYEPYFYVLPVHIERARKDIENKLKVEHMNIKRIEIENRIVHGEERAFLKIYTHLPQDTQKIRDIIKVIEKKRGGTGSILDEYEYQIGFYRCYLVDRGTGSLTWLEVEGERVGGDFISDIILNARKIKKIDGELYPLKIISFDTEVLEEKRGERQIVMLSIYGDGLRKVLTYKKGDYPDYVEVVKDEKDLIKRFLEIIEGEDPDIITGFNSDLFDFVVLRERAEKLKVNLDNLSLDRSGINLSKRARVTTARLIGRVHIDIFNFVNNILSSILQTEVLSLDSVSSEILGDEKIEMEYSDILEAWKEGRRIEKLAEYSLKDSELTYRLSMVLLPQIYELTGIVGQSLFDVSRMTYSQLVEWYYTKRAKEMGRIIPNQPTFDEIKKRQKETYTGGFVKEPLQGLHEDIAVIDFASLYPSIASTYNISTETLNCVCCKKDAHRVPELPYWFCKERKGFESNVIEELLKERQRIKNEMKGLQRSSHEYHILDTRQKAIKTIANASYGYYAFPASKWYSRECAESITAYGRYWIQWIMERSQKEGFIPIYGDTDSAFLAMNGKKREDIINFLERVNRELPGIMHIELEDIYLRGIFIPREIGGGTAKKRYALINEKGILKIRGLERVRRDWSPVSKRTQEEILRLVLEKKDINGAVNLVRERIKRLKRLDYELRDLVVYEQLSKPISEYKQLLPHVSAARKLVDKGITVDEGSVIGFVIERGKGSISERAQPVEFADLKRVDTEYYINNQILPASLRILRLFGIDERELIE